MWQTSLIIPGTDEKLIAVEIGFLIKMRPNKNGVDKPVYEHIRILDSFRITPSALDTPYCYHGLREEMFMRKILHDPDWSSSDDEETNVHFAESTKKQSPPITLYTKLPKTWSPPDPCLNQREYSENEHDIVNFANLTQQESEGELDRCSITDDQATESDSSPSLLDLRSVSLIRLPTNTSTQNQSIAVEISFLNMMRPNKNGVDKPVCEHIRLLGSFRITPSALDALTKNLPAKEFTLLEDCFKDWPESSLNLLKQKSFFPYDYIDSFAKLRETELPSSEKWSNGLPKNETEDEYNHFLTVFETFKCKIIGDYYHLFFENGCFSPCCCRTLLSQGMLPNF